MNKKNKKYVALILSNLILVPTLFFSISATNHKKENTTNLISNLSTKSLYSQGDNKNLLVEKTKDNSIVNNKTFGAKIVTNSAVSEANTITGPIGSINLTTNKLEFKAAPAGFSFNFIGADYEQIIDKDRNVFKPLTAKEVTYDVELINNSDPKDRTTIKNQKIQVPGLNVQLANKNQKPNIVPSISEWFSNVDSGNETSKLKLADDLQIYIVGEKPNQTTSINSMLDRFREQYRPLTKRMNITVRRFQTIPNDIAAGSLVFDFSNSMIPGFDNETYGMNIGDNDIKIQATSVNGAYSSIQSLLQMLKVNGASFNMIDKGIIKDYPKFKLRGISLDVAKKPVSLDTLKNLIREMSWYKLNQLQLNLSDNSYFIEDHVGNGKRPEDVNKGFNTYSAFRLESTTSNSGKVLTSSDYSYSKDDFRELIQYARSMGVSIVPNINMPGHALSITKVFSELANRNFPKDGPNPNRPFLASLDLTKPETISTLRIILGEYIDGQGSIFGSGTGITLNIGGEEFNGNSKLYYEFLKQMYDFFKTRSVPLRINGTFSQIGEIENNPITKEIAKDIELVVLNTTIQDPNSAYSQGFKLINSLDSNLLINPSLMDSVASTPLSVGNGFLNINNLYTSWSPEIFNTSSLPIGSEQLLGALINYKNDFSSDTRNNGFSEYDIYSRLVYAIPTFSQKTWGENAWTFAQFNSNVAKINSPIDINPGRKIELLENRKDYFLYDFSGPVEDEKTFDKRGTFGFINDFTNASLNKENADAGSSGSKGFGFLQLAGNNSNAVLPVGVLGVNNSLKFKIKREKTTAEQSEEIIFSAKAAYGKFAIKAKQIGTGKFGFSREGIDYSFDYELPLDKWVDIELRNALDKNGNGSVTLFVDGISKSILGGKVYIDSKPLSKVDGNEVTVGNTTRGSTFFFPLELIGAASNSFKGNITNITSEPLNNITHVPEQRNPELIRLQNIPFTIKNKPVLSTSALKVENFIIEGINNANETIETKITSINNHIRRALINVTITSKSKPEIKFSRDYSLLIETESATVLKEISESTKSDNQLTTFTLQSITEYRKKINELQGNVNNNTNPTEKNIEEFRSQLKAINTDVLKTFSDDINQRVTAFRALNKNLYDATTYQAAKTEFDAVEKEFKAATNVTQTTHKAFEDRLVKVNNDLVTYKTLVLRKVTEELGKVNSNVVTPESFKEFSTQLNDIKNEVNADNEVTLEKQKAFEARLSKLPALVTLKSVLEKTVKDLEASIEIDKFQEVGRNAYNTAISEIKTLLNASENVGLNQFNSINSRIQRIRRGLVPIQEIQDNPSSKEPVQVITPGQVTGIVFGVIFAILFFSIVLYKFFPSGKKIKSKKKSKNKKR